MFAFSPAHFFSTRLHMRKVLIFLLACISSVAAAQQPRIDASSPKALERSYAKVIENLDDEAQQRFAVAMTTIGVVMAQRPDLGGSAKIKDMIDGKTADEIIAESKKLTGQIKMNIGRIDGSSTKRFSETLGSMLISLPDGKRELFSEAAAKLIYERENKKMSEADFLKSVDGKTADEIIDMARAIELPFVVSPSRAQNAQIERVSSKELKERFGIDSESKKENKEPQKALDFSNSLVPPKK